MATGRASSPGMDGYRTRGGIVVRREVEEVPLEGAVEDVVEALDNRKGAVFASSYEYPGRYTRWDLGFVDPPLEVICSGREFAIRALNGRGRILMPAVASAVGSPPAVGEVVALGY